MGFDYDRSSKFNSAITPRDVIAAPSFAIIDVNQDMLMDFLITTDKRIYLFINSDGLKFLDASEEYGLKILPSNTPDFSVRSGPILIADFNGDGRDDIVIGTYPEFTLFYGQGPGKPYNHAPKAFPSSGFSVQSLGVIDLDRDGVLEIIVATWSRSLEEIKNKTQDKYSIYNTKYNEPNGGKNIILKRRSDGHYSVDENFDFSPSSYSHAIGVLDINRDGWDDILITNDYSKSQIFKNISGKKIVDATQSFISDEKLALSGMGLSLADLNNDGRIDVLKTNVHRPPIRNFENLIFMTTNNNQLIVNENKTGLEKCGFAWGAQFADFDNNGELDVIMANGLMQSLNANEYLSPSIWFRRYKVSQIPNFLKSFRGNYEFPHDSEFQFSAFERDCLFLYDNGRFVDVSLSAGLTEKKVGRGVTIVDFNNDGKLDFIISNVLASPDIYYNQTSSNKDWIGFRLIDKNGSNFPIGTEIRLHLKNKKSRYFKFYPSNGFRAQADPRLHFGLDTKAEIISLEVNWPDKKREFFYQLTKNSYHDIRKDTGK